MFKKKPQIKNLSPLRSSDRRKLADQIISDFAIKIPTPVTQSIPSETTSTEPEQPQVTLSSIRTSLLPENTSSARFTTTAGANATLVSGTVYVGTHPGQDERILWVQYGKDPKLIPTVYSLWHNPDIIPLLHTQDFVVDEKLRGGADLMVPGLVKARGQLWDQRAKKGSVAAVAGISKDTVPVWVGICEIDVSALKDDTRGQKGVAIKGFHWEGDEIWNWSAVGKGGRPSPQDIDGWNGIVDGATRNLDRLDLDHGDSNSESDDDKEGEEDDDIDGGAALDKSTGDVRNGNSTTLTSNVHEAPETTKENAADDDHEPTTKEVDEAFIQAFLFAVHTAMKDNSSPSYGFDFPIQPSYLISNMIQPFLRYQTPHYNIKKTSWKNTKKFIKHLDKAVLVKSKDRNGGETVILDIDFNDQQIKTFTPYKLPKPKPTHETNEATGSKEDDSGDSSLNQKLSIRIMYRASSKLVPHLLPSKTDFYTAQEVSEAIKRYVEANPMLLQGTLSARYIKIDPFIANNILASNPSQSDNKILAAGQVARDVLARRILEDDHLAIPYHVVLREGSSSSGTGRTIAEMKPKSGPIPKVQVTVEKRTGTKVVTKISNLEPFYVNPQLLAPEIQKKCAGSASVGQHVGGKPGMLEIVVQGDQRDILTRDILARRGIDPKWVVIDDKTKKKAKK